MKSIVSVLPCLGLVAGTVLLTSPAVAQTAPAPAAAPATFTITVRPPVNGTIEVVPALPADGKVAPGTVFTVKATPAPGFAIDSVFYSIPGRFAGAEEFMGPEIKVTADRNKNVGATFIEPKALEGFIVKQNIVFAKPGVKTLKYDVFTPNGAKNLPAIVIIHGGGWAANTEDIMRGLARELVRDGKYVVASVDYRWIGTSDGDKTPNSMAALVEDVLNQAAARRGCAGELRRAGRMGNAGDIGWRDGAGQGWRGHVIPSIHREETRRDGRASH